MTALGIVLGVLVGLAICFVGLTVYVLSKMRWV